jgi:hypothetical protein
VTLSSVRPACLAVGWNVDSIETTPSKSAVLRASCAQDGSSGPPKRSTWRAV